MKSFFISALSFISSFVSIANCAPKAWGDGPENAYDDPNAVIVSPTGTASNNRQAGFVPYSSLEDIFNRPYRTSHSPSASTEADYESGASTSSCSTGDGYSSTPLSSKVSVYGTGSTMINTPSGPWNGQISGSAPSHATGRPPPYPASGAPYQNATLLKFPSRFPPYVPSPSKPPYGSVGLPDSGASGLENQCPPAVTVTIPASTVTLPPETITITAQAEAQAQASAQAEAGGQSAPAAQAQAPAQAQAQAQAQASAQASAQAFAQAEAEGQSPPAQQAPVPAQAQAQAVASAQAEAGVQSAPAQQAAAPAPAQAQAQAQAFAQAEAEGQSTSAQPAPALAQAQAQASAQAEAKAEAEAEGRNGSIVTITTTVTITVSADQGANCPTGGSEGNVPAPSLGGQPSAGLPDLPESVPAGRFPSAGFGSPSAPFTGGPTGGFGLPSTKPLNVAPFPSGGFGGTQNVSNDVPPVISPPINPNIENPSPGLSQGSNAPSSLPFPNESPPTTAPYTNSSRPSGGVPYGSGASAHGPSGSSNVFPMGHGNASFPFTGPTTTSQQSRPKSSGASQHSPAPSRGFSGTGPSSATGHFPPNSRDTSQPMSNPHRTGSAPATTQSSTPPVFTDLPQSSTGMHTFNTTQIPSSDPLPAVSLSSTQEPPIPSDSSAPCIPNPEKKQSFVATYDDLRTLSVNVPGIPSEAINNIFMPDINVGTLSYQGLDYTKFNTIQNLLAASQPMMLRYQPSSPDEKVSKEDRSKSGPAPSNLIVPAGGKGTFSLQEMMVACLEGTNDGEDGKGNSTAVKRRSWLRTRGGKGEDHKGGEEQWKDGGCDTCAVVVSGLAGTRSVQAASIAFNPKKTGMQKITFGEKWKDLTQVSIGAQYCGKASTVAIDDMKYELTECT